MRRKLSIWLCTVLLTGCLTGCGGEYTEMPGRNGAVSGTAVSGQAVRENGESHSKNTFPNFCTDTDWYRERDVESGIIQSRLDGSEARAILKDRADWIVSVVDEYLYYVTVEEEPEQSICRVPIGKDINGNDKVLENAEQKLITVKNKDTDYDSGLDGIYVNSQFILYSIQDNGKYQFMQYDLETGEKRKAGVLPLNDIGSDITVDLVGCGDYILAMSFLDGVFVRETEGEKWTKISDYDAVHEEGTWNELYYFFSDGEKQDGGIPKGIYRYAFQNGTREQLVSPEQLSMAAKEAQGLPDEKMIDACAVTDLFLSGERLYFQVQLNWKEGKEYHIAYLMFSQGQDELQSRYEKELTECMRKHGTWRNGRWETKLLDENEDGILDYEVTENIVCNDGRCFDIIKGKAYMMFCDGYVSEKMWADRIGCYDLNTGDFRWITESNPEYFEPAHEFAGAAEYFLSERSYTQVYETIGTGMEWGPKGDGGLVHRSALGDFRESESSGLDG